MVLRRKTCSFFAFETTEIEFETAYQDEQAAGLDFQWKFFGDTVLILKRALYEFKTLGSIDYIRLCIGIELNVRGRIVQKIAYSFLKVKASQVVDKHLERHVHGQLLQLMPKSRLCSIQLLSNEHQH